MAVKIGITGGIGSGKSYVCAILEKMGYPVYYSDLASKQLTVSHPEIRKGLITLLGEEVFQNNELNRPFLASKLFQDDFVRQQVNAIIHPVVRADFNNWSQKQTSPVVFNEAAILIETGSYKTLDFLVLVTADQELRIERTMNRDTISREEVLARMSKQWSDEEKMKYVDFVIYNDDRPLLTQLEKMIEEIQLKR
jgi:dephospho-CoA kinase